jgi:hypothetical protein
MFDVEFTPQQIDRMCERATKFLGAVSQVPAIRSLLHLGGYTAGEHAHGWDLLLRLLGYQQATDPVGSPQEIRQRAATVALDEWDGRGFERARAALDHRFPSQSRYVFDGLCAGTGAEAIGTVRTFLDRVAALRDGTDLARSATRDADREAAELLVVRRITHPAEEQRLRTLIAEATSLPDLPPPAQPDPTLRQQTAHELAAWLRDWRETARVLVVRRDYLIRLGLAERRNGKGAVRPSAEPEATGSV